MNLFKKILSLIAAFALVISLGILIANNIVQNKLLNRDYTKQKVDESEFYLQISREVQNGFEKHSKDSKLPEGMVDGLFTESMIKKDVRSLIDCVYDGSKISISEESVEKNIDSKIDEYVQSGEIVLDAETNTNIERFKKLILNEYRQNINISSSGYTAVHNVVKGVQEISEEIGKLPLLLTCVLVIIIVCLNMNHLLRAMNYISISVFSLGIIIKLCVSIFLSKINLDSLVVMTMSITNFIINVMKETLMNLDEIGAFCIVCGITGIIASVALKGDLEEAVEIKEKEIKPKRRKLKK